MCKVMPIKRVAEHYDLHWGTVKDIDKAYLERTLEPARPGKARLRMMDEFALHSIGHLQRRTLTWFSKRNAAPRPFKWSFRGYHLQTGEPKKAPGRKSDAQTRRAPRRR